MSSVTAIDRRDRHLVIGAGYSGLPVATALLDAGVPYDHVEMTDRVGGNWAHRVYDSTHLISSSRSTQYDGFPMPGSYPDFPSRDQMLAYLEAFADAHGLTERIEFETEVVDCRPLGDRGLDGWRVTLGSGEVRDYAGVIVANGHYFEANVPVYPGEFAGRQIHSRDYKRPADLKGPRVLVVGAGNSACDMAVESAATFGSCELSVRGGAWFMPKTLFGVPVSDIDVLPLPAALQALAFKLGLRIAVGDYRRYGLPKPDHDIFDKDVTVNSQLLYALRHGRVRVRAAIESFDGDVVRFADGSSGEYDTILWATGYKTRFPFLPPDSFVWKNGQPELIGHVLVPGRANLYVFGLVAPRGGAGAVLTRGARQLAQVIELQARLAVPVSTLARPFLGKGSSILAGNSELLQELRVGGMLVRAGILATRSPIPQVPLIPMPTVRRPLAEWDFSTPVAPREELVA